jgi:uncharacterized lipoprotein YmbA
MNDSIHLKAAAALAISLCLTACGSSPPSHFYRLTPASAAIGASQQPALGIGPVRIPEFLDRSALVFSGEANRLQVAGTELWAEPLADGVQRVVGMNVAQLVGSDNLSYFPWDPRHAPQYGIRINVLDLDADAQRATLVADWELYRPGDGATVRKRISTFTHALAGQPLAASELPAAYSALLLQLSETIAAAIREDQQQPG